MVGIAPEVGFNWMQVAWAGPDEPVPDACSYCGDPLPDDDYDFVPLMLWNDEGWAAYFCDHCQARWWGMRSF